MDRAINAILDQAYTQARESLLAQIKRLTRVAAYLYEHERSMEPSSRRSLTEASLLRPIWRKQWRSAESKPRSWDEIDDLVATSVATADTSGVARMVARSTAPLPIRRRRTRRQTLASARVLLLNWWQRTLPGTDRPAD